MSSPERFVGGLFCRQVMDLLPDYVDGALPLDDRDRLVAHVVGCPNCERFGGAYGAVVARLREQALPSDAIARLQAALEQALDDGT